jgi:SAM-dependent methyltransferase
MKNYRPSYLFILKKRLQSKSWLVDFYFKNKKVLDIGCGEGDFVKIDKDNFYGIDINKRVVSDLQAKGLQVKLGSVDKIDYPDSFFEGIYCHNVIEHLSIDKAYDLIKESARVLAKDGLFILASELVTRKFWHTFGHVKPYPPEAVLKLLRHDSREEFEGINCFEKVGIIYFGQYFKSKAVYLVITFIAYYLPFFRREYYLVLKKK